jgi:hypothetical protein
MSAGGPFNAEPIMWLGETPADYRVKLLSNGGLASLHLRTGKQVPHVHATVAQHATPSTALVDASSAGG